MTISVWRYSHLALAVSSFLFIALAAITGFILAFKPITEKTAPYRISGFDTITVAQAVPALKKSFTEITDVTVDINGFVTVKGIDTADKNVTAYVDAKTGATLGKPPKESEIFQWVTSLHRSLFLHETGRIFVGVTAFFLLLIAVSGTALIIQRQRGVKRFFTKVVKENFAQYYHVVLGRLSLVVIIIITATGTYLSLARFNFFKEEKVAHKINFDEVKSEPQRKPIDFPVFKNTLLADVESIEYPFSDDPEDYYTLKLRDKEILVSQVTGEALSEIAFSRTTIFTKVSLNLHTGRTSAIWAIVLAIASLNILFFIYSGFAITWRRTRGRTKNKYKAEESRFIILVGSENGSTMRFANAVHQQLISSGHRSFITELNRYQNFPKAEHLLILTATYGLGEAPSNAKKFSSLIDKFSQDHPIQFSVVGFGSHSYPDFCRFAFEANNMLSAQPWAKPLLEIHTINDKSPQEFSEWFTTWSQMAGLPSLSLPALLNKPPAGLQKFVVTHKTALQNGDGAFIIRLKPLQRTKFRSGDLLAIHPGNDHRERLYSIGRIGKEIQLSVKCHQGGLGSGFLYNLEPGQNLKARITANNHFHFPSKAKTVILISNGTGIAPFLGMIDANTQSTNCYLYCGFRNSASFALYNQALQDALSLQQLTQLHIAYSREGEKQYVKDLVKQDADFVAAALAGGGVIMLCGSLVMQNDMIVLLEELCVAKAGKPLSFYQSHGQILMDCY